MWPPKEFYFGDNGFDGKAQIGQMMEMEKYAVAKSKTLFLWVINEVWWQQMSYPFEFSQKYALVYYFTLLTHCARER